jgi:hypothetical protein
VTIVVGLVATKALATVLGPDGIGLIGLLQSLVGMVSLVASMGIGAALVREGAVADQVEQAVLVEVLPVIEGAVSSLPELRQALEQAWVIACQLRRLTPVCPLWRGQWGLAF